MTRLVLQTFSNNTYGGVNSLNTTFTTKCFSGKQSTRVYSCAYSDGTKYNINVQCDGKLLLLLLLLLLYFIAITIIIMFRET